MSHNNNEDVYLIWIVFNLDLTRIIIKLFIALYLMIFFSVTVHVHVFCLQELEFNADIETHCTVQENAK